MASRASCRPVADPTDRMAETPAFAIKPLDPSTSAAAKALIRRIFTDESMLDRLNIAFLGTPLQAVSRLYGVEDQRVWVAVLPDGDVAGTTGLYAVAGDADALWLGWFCVANAARGRGIGAALLDHSIALARASGRPLLRLSTSTDPSERAAQALYESRGLKIVERSQPLSWIGSGIEELTRELRL